MFQTRSTTSRSSEGSPSQPLPMAAAAAAAPLNTSADSSANLDDDPNSSIIKKVRSRVSSILPDLSKWFSQTPSKRPRDTGGNSSGQGTPTGRNGNLLRLRRRESGSSGPDEMNQFSDQNRHREEEEEEQDVEEEENEDDADHAPPIRKKKRIEESFHVSFSDELESPSGPTGLNISAIHRRSSLSSGGSLLPRSSGYSSVFSSSTPSTSPQGLAAAGTSSSLIPGRVQKTNTAVGFASLPRSPLIAVSTGTKRFSPSTDEPRDSRHEQQHHRQELNESLSTSIRHRRSIREVGNRKRLNIPPMAVDRSTSEPPAPTYSGLRAMSGSTLAQSTEQHSSEEEEFIGDGNPTSRTVTAHKEVEDKTLSNGNLNESASENSSVSNLNLSQTEPTEPRRLSSFMGNARSKRFLVGGSTGDLCFSSHLETEKSLFSSKNAGRIGRPTFNASLYGSTSSLGSSHSSLFSNSPFYNGRTTYGGASAYSARRDIRQKALRVPVQMRPSSSLSNFSSSNVSLASDTTALSNTAKRILEIMNQCSGPLTEARKLGSSLSLNSSLASAKVPGLVQARKRFNEEDLNVNRSIRMSSPRTPYSRPVSATSGLGAASINKPPTAELLIPSQSQLLQMKRLQANTESARRLATGSTGGTMLSEPSEYKLPTESDDSNNNVKHTSKMRSKLHRVREESSADRSSNTPVPQVNLPDVQLAGLKSVPKFDIKLLVPAGGSGGEKDTSKATISTTVGPKTHHPTFSSDNDANRQRSSATNSDNSSPADVSQSTPAFNNIYKFAAPAKLDLPFGKGLPNNASAISSFKFSEPQPIKSTESSSSPSTAPMLAGFQYNPDMAKPKVTVTPSGAATLAVQSEKPILPLKSGSCLDALKAPVVVPTLKTGSCLDVLTKQQDSSPASSVSPSSTSSATNIGSFGSAFKLAGSNKWECDTCMVRNEPDKVKCAACDTPKPGSKAAQTVPTGDGATSKFSFGSIPAAASTTAPPADAGFKALVAQQSDKWECSDCMTRNDSNKLKCVCCEKAKPGAPSTSTAPVIPAVVQSMFAMPATATSSSSSASVSSDKSFKLLAAQQSANRWECSACLTRNEAARSKCVCCDQAKPGSTPADAPSFSFGQKSSTSSGNSSSTTTAAAATFSFGVPQKTDDCKDAPKPMGFTLGVPVSAAAAASPAAPGGFTFGATNVASTTATSSGEKPGFSFGINTGGNQGAATSSPSFGFSFGVSKPAAATDVADSGKRGMEKKEESKSGIKLGAGGFSFGAKPAPEEGQKSEAVTSTTTTSGGFSFGAKPEESSKSGAGFSFGKPADASSSVVSTTTPTTSTSSNSSGPSEDKKPVISAAVSFGAIATGTTTSLTAAAAATGAASSSISFSSPKEKAVTPSDAKPAPPAGPGMFSFGTHRPTASGSTASPSAPAVQPATSQTKEASTPAATNVPIFGGVQKPAGPSITPSFSFGSTATSNATTTPSTTGSPAAFSIFGGAVAKTTSSTSTTAVSTSSTSTPATVSSSPGFSTARLANQQPAVVPTFGTVASSSGLPTSTDKPPSFGSFGSAGANQTGTPVISNSIFGAAPTGSTGFGFTSSTTSSTAKSTESATSAFTFGGNKVSAATTAAADSMPAFGTAATNSAPKSLFEFRCPPESSVTGFGALGTTGTNVGINSSAFGHVFGAGSSSVVAGSSSSPSRSLFGQSPSAPSLFGGATTGGNTLGAAAAAAAPSFGAAPAEFGSVANAGSLFGSYTTVAATGAVHTGEEPASKKPFKFGSNTGSMTNQAGAPSPFQFSAGTNSNPSNNNNNAGDNSAKPFAFSAHSTPNFNFTAGSNAGQTSAPFTFGTNQSVPTAGGVFNFGGGAQSPASSGLGGIVEAAPVAAAPPFQFGASMPPQQNPFAATSLPGQNLQAAQRRKIRTATRRMTQR